MFSQLCSSFPSDSTACVHWRHILLHREVT